MFKDEKYVGNTIGSDEVGTVGHEFSNEGHAVDVGVSHEALDGQAIDLVGHVRKASETFLACRHEMTDHRTVADVRDVGLFCGFEVMKDAKTRESFDPSWKVGELMQDFAHDCGLWLRAIGDPMSSMPPLNVSEDEIEIAAERFPGALDDVWAVVRDRV